MKSNRQRVKNSKNSWAIFDVHAVLHFIKHSMLGLGYDGEDTGVIYGFLSQFLFIQQQLRCKQFLFCWDSKSNLRKKLYPDYKKSRVTVTREPDEIALDNLIYEQFDKLRDEILPALGFANSWKRTGLEADDIIAEICHNKNNANPKIIISRDNDLWQLLNPSTTCFDFVKRTEFNVTQFRRKWNIHPKYWGTVKTIAGCPGDGVPGINRVGPPTAIKYLNGQMNPKTKTYKSIVSDEGQAIIKRNRELVVLPSPNPILSKEPFQKELKVQKNDLSWDRFEAVCDLYGFDSFLEDKKAAQWKKALGVRG